MDKENFDQEEKRLQRVTVGYTLIWNTLDRKIHAKITRDIFPSIKKTQKKLEQIKIDFEYFKKHLSIDNIDSQIKLIQENIDCTKIKMSAVINNINRIIAEIPELNNIGKNNKILKTIMRICDRFDSASGRGRPNEAHTNWFLCQLSEEFILRTNGKSLTDWKRLYEFLCGNKHIIPSALAKKLSENNIDKKGIEQKVLRYKDKCKQYNIKPMVSYGQSQIIQTEKDLEDYFNKSTPI